MTLTTQIARNYREQFLNGQWTAPNLKQQVSDLTWQQATMQVHGLNTIALLIFHMHYYVAAVLKVLRGGPLDASDKYSFDMPPIQSQEDWEALLNTTWTDVAALADLIEQLPDSRLTEPFLDGKYGTYFRNLEGIVHHSFYHIGQVAMLRKIVLQQEQADS